MNISPVKLVIGAVIVIALVGGSLTFVVAGILFSAIGAAACLVSSPLRLFTQFSTTPLPSTTDQGIAFFAQFQGNDRTQREAMAQLIISIGQQRGFTPKAIEVALATALQESRLTNPTSGNLDSIGVFQQRPSKGWGTQAELAVPSFQIENFYDRMAGIPANEIASEPIIVIAERIQVPNKADYAKGFAEYGWDSVATAIYQKFAVQSGSAATPVLPSTAVVQNVPKTTASCTLAGDLTGSNDTASATSGAWQGPLAGTYKQGEGFGERIWPFPPFQLEFHNGVDLEVRYGTPVYAVHDGTVASAQYTGTLGEFVLLNNGDNIQSGYAHLSSYAAGITPGAQVSEGQVIGYVGSTGASTGPHLDFEIRVNGNVVDPVPFMAHQGVVIP